MKKRDKSTILNKQEDEENKLEKFLIKISPYLIFIMFFILIILLFIMLVKYGSNMFGSESNRVYYHLNDSIMIINTWGLIYG